MCSLKFNVLPRKIVDQISAYRPLVVTNSGSLRETKCKICLNSIGIVIKGFIIINNNIIKRICGRLGIFPILCFGSVRKGYENKIQPDISIILVWI